MAFMKTILLTGATGFLGSNLAHRLVEIGHRVLVLKRPSSNLARIADILPYLSLYDIKSPDLSAPFRDHGKVDAIFHTATCYGHNGETSTEILDTNTAFPLRLLETAALFDTRAFFNSDTFFNTDDINCNYLSRYVLSKNNFLKWAKLFSEDHKIRFVNIRIEHMFGPGDAESKFTTQIVKSCLANVPEIKLTLGEQKRDFIFVSDVVDAYEVLLEKTGNGEDFFQHYDLGSGKSVSIREFVETFHKLSKSTTYLNFGGLPYRNNEIMSSVANLEKMISLGWRCRTSLSEGLEKIICYEKGLQRRGDSWTSQ